MFINIVYILIAVVIFGAFVYAIYMCVTTYKDSTRIEPSVQKVETAGARKLIAIFGKAPGAKPSQVKPEKIVTSSRKELDTFGQLG